MINLKLNKIQHTRLTCVGDTGLINGHQPTGNRSVFNRKSRDLCGVQSFGGTIQIGKDNMPNNPQHQTQNRAQAWYQEAQDVLMASRASHPVVTSQLAAPDAAKGLRAIVESQAELLREQAALLADQSRIIAQSSSKDAR